MKGMDMTSQERVARALVPPIHHDEDRSDQDYDDVYPERFLRYAAAALAALGQFVLDNEREMGPDIDRELVAVLKRFATEGPQE
jgi:hypothetical protein